MLKTGRLLLFLIGYSSCHHVDRNGGRHASPAPGWEIVGRSFSTNTYGRNGLPDTSFETRYIYVKGQFIDSSRSIKTRKYDGHNNLVEQKDIDYPEPGKELVIYQTVNFFDNQNRKIREIGYWKGMEMYRLRYSFDRTGFCTQLFSINHSPEQLAGDRLPDDAAWDTSISTFINDGAGNNAKAIVCKPANDTQRVVYNSFVDKKMISAYTLDKNGDTAETITFLKDGIYDMEIDDKKNFGHIDTIWREDDHIHQRIDHNFRRRNTIKQIYSYDLKGNETRSTTYRLLE